MAAVAPAVTTSRRNSFLDVHAEITDVNKKGENQDSQLSIAPLLGNNSQALFLVFDGHGHAGKFASVFAIHRVAFHIEEKLAKFTKPTEAEVKQLLVDSFLEADKECTASKVPVQLSGTTATACLILNDTDLYVANCGDSRAVMACVGTPEIVRAAQLKAPQQTVKMYTPNGAPMLNDQGRVLLQDAEEQLSKRIPTGHDVVGYALCRDHNATLPDEAERVKAHGGVCFKYMGEGPMRIFLKNQFTPGICPSRTIGDQVAAGVGVTAEPEVHKFTIGTSDVALIIASDGLWDVLDNDQTARIVMAHSDPTLAVKLLLEVAEKGKNDDGDINEDNVTVQVIYVNQPLGETTDDRQGAVHTTGSGTAGTDVHARALKIEASLVREAQGAGGGDAARLCKNSISEGKNVGLSCEALEAWFMEEMTKDPETAERLGVHVASKGGCCAVS